MEKTKVKKTRGGLSPEPLSSADEGSRGAGSRAYPEKYDIKITLAARDDERPELTVELDGVLRSDILDPNYRNDGIASLVRSMDRFVYDSDPPIQSLVNPRKREKLQRARPK